MSHDIRTIVQPNIASRQLDFLIDTVDVRDEDIIANKLRLTQVLLNILSNGIKFNKIGGTIGIRVKQLKSAPTGYGSYQFIIRDTGIGMKPEFQEHIFESFSREETSTVSGIQGTGLGMAITETILEDAGFVIETANNGKTAVEIMEKAAPGQYDLILMDIQMPVMDGYEATRRIRALSDKEKASVPIVAMTANAFEDDRKNALNAGMNGHIAKPLDLPKLFRVLSELVR